jgi:hypothetical protein
VGAIWAAVGPFVHLTTGCATAADHRGSCQGSGGCMEVHDGEVFRIARYISAIMTEQTCLLSAIREMSSWEAQL